MQAKTETTIKEESIGNAEKIVGRIKASYWRQLALTDWLKSRCPDEKSHSRMQCLGTASKILNTTLDIFDHIFQF